METDSPNLFKGATAVPAMGQALKTTSTMVIQDMFGTYKVLGDMLKIDAGYTLPAASHNALQSAFTLFGWDYFAYTFQNSNAFGAVTPPVGRDLGVQVRGLVVDGHIEYRVGIWQGQRNAAVAAGSSGSLAEQSARNFFRTAARLQINIFDPETGLLLRRDLSRREEDPVAGRFVRLSVRLQGVRRRRFPRYAAGARCRHRAGRLLALGWGRVSPATQAVGGSGRGRVHLPARCGGPDRPRRASAYRPTTAAPNGTTQNRYAGGLAYWCYGHNSNLKLFYTRIQEDGAPHGANQINLQWQIFVY